MAPLISPGVSAKERDFSLIVPNVSTTESALVGQFVWGPVEVPMLIDSEEELVSTFWKPNNQVADDWFTASNYLSYTDKLWTVRVVENTTANTVNRATNASANTGFLVKNNDHYFDNYNDGSLKLSFNTGDWIAKYPGALGNSIKVSVCSGGNAFQSNLTGTVTIVPNSTTVTGTGTTFTAQLQVGDHLTVANETIRVASITSATVLTLANPHFAGATAATAIRRWEYYFEHNTAPNTSIYTSSLGGSNDEMHVVVVDEEGTITGTPNTVLEKWSYLSKATDAKVETGATNYYKEVINQESQWIRWAGHPAIANIGSNAKNTAFGTNALPQNYSFQNGRDGTTVTNSHRIVGWDMFKSEEDYDISFLLGSAADTTLGVYLINNIAEVRQDCVAFLSPARSMVVNNKGNEATACIAFRNSLPSTSYAALDNNWKYQYDRYNDLYRYVPMNGDVAGIHVRSDEDLDAWWPAAGLNRGHVKNSIKLAWNAKQADRDLLYKNGVNPVVTFKGEGTVLFGQKTLLAKPSSFDRINVRRLFIVLRKAISKMARYFLFEFNDEISRRRFVSIVEPYLRDVKGRRGITKYLVVCDATNNTAEVINRNEFIGTVIVVPNYSAEFITLNFVNAKNGLRLEEIVSQL